MNCPLHLRELGRHAARKQEEAFTAGPHRILFGLF
jgi:hypothetical protein